MISFLKKIKKLNLEPPVFLVFFATVLASNINTNLIIYRTCYVSLDYQEADCALLGKDYSDNATAELEVKVQPYATTILTSSAVIQAIFPTIMSFFVGPWSDTYGRKPLLLATVGGYAVTFAILVIVSSIKSASPWFVLLFLAPHCVTGGLSAFITVVLCYINDVTSEEYKGLRMGLFESIIQLGTIVGTTLSSFVLNAFGYEVVYAISCTCAVVAWFYIFLLIPESVPNVKSEGRLRNLFKFSLVKAAIKTASKKRRHHERTLLWVVTMMMVLAVFTAYGNNGVIFLFLRRKFQWTLEKFTIYSAIVEAVAVVGAIIGILVLHKMLHVREAVIIFCGFMSTLSSSLLQGLASESWHMYAAGLIKALNGWIQPMGRFLLSKIITADDSGKLFSLVSAAETIAGLVGIIAYTNIYNVTLVEYPETFSFVSAGIYGLEIVLVVVIAIIERSHKRLEITKCPTTQTDDKTEVVHETGKITSLD